MADMDSNDSPMDVVEQRYPWTGEGWERIELYDRDPITGDPPHLDVSRALRRPRAYRGGCPNTDNLTNHRIIALSEEEIGRLRSAQSARQDPEFGVRILGSLVFRWLVATQPGLREMRQEDAMKARAWRRQYRHPSLGNL